MRSALIRDAVLLLSILVVTGRSHAAILKLPAEWPLDADSRLYFELNGAELHLTTQSEGVPVLEARVLDGAESATLEAISSGGRLTLRRASGEEEQVPRLRIDVALGPGRTVEVSGVDLTVHAEDPLPAGSGSGSIRLALERSTAKLSGVRISELSAVASSVTLIDTRAPVLALTLTGGSARVQRHQGRLELLGTESNVRVIGHQGQLVPTLEGGSLEITGGGGAFEGTVVGAGLSFDDWRGPVIVRARDSRVDILGGEHRDRWQIDGRDSEIFLEEVRGTIEATLVGSQLSANHLAAAVRVAADGTQVDLAGVAGSVTLALTDHADAVITGIVGKVEASVTASRLELERVERLKLTGSGANVSVRNIARLEPLWVEDSQLALDLRECRQDPILDLQGVGYTRVRVRAPCRVRLNGEAPLSAQIEVNGCDLSGADPRGAPSRERLEDGGVQPFTLRVSASADTVLEIEGEP